jgi:hypothetical protein
MGFNSGCKGLTQGLIKHLEAMPEKYSTDSLQKQLYFEHHTV